MKSPPIRAVKTCKVAVIREDIAAHRDELVALCRDYGVRRLEILGSGARDIRASLAGRAARFPRPPNRIHSRPRNSRKDAAMSVNKQLVLDSRPADKVAPVAFPARRGADAQARRGRDSRAQSFSLARSLHARPAQRRQILRQAAGDRGGDGRRDGRRGRRVRTIRASRPAISSSAWAAGSNIS